MLHRISWCFRMGQVYWPKEQYLWQSYLARKTRVIQLGYENKCPNIGILPSSAVSVLWVYDEKNIIYCKPVYTHTVNFSHRISITCNALLFLLYYLKTKYKSWATKLVSWSICGLLLEVENHCPGHEVEAAFLWAVAWRWEERREGGREARKVSTVTDVALQVLLIIVSRKSWGRENKVNAYYL